ncbi:MAG: PilT/PilU family type 4a pilus ATPase [Parcubacteria group bacterium]|nr:PilT/PilU family type 4a pilus ATPase [Parcubacteria group bacterium]
MDNAHVTIERLADTVSKEGGSDLHLHDGGHPIIRVAGSLIPLVKEPVLSVTDMQGIAEYLLGKERYERFLLEREIDFSYTTTKDGGGEKARFRGNAYFERGSISIALRLIPAKIQTLDELNLPKTLEIFARREQGFFLVVGPVGHGKSTTLASLVDTVNRERAAHILTIEDPIEFTYTPAQSLIDQREVGIDTADFATALRAMFRQDIDVVMIGEMRGPATISAAVTAAETGHLVYSTLHTNNAAQTVDRIIDSFPGEQQNQIKSQLAQSLAGIFSQRLIPRISGGLIPAYELLINNSAVSNLIREGRVYELNVVIETGAGEGMIDMNRTLAELVRRGEITVENAQLYSPNPQGLGRLV